MDYFKKYYSDVDFENKTEVKVLCPFHNDTHPSAYINTDKSVFYCHVCGLGLSEKQFYQKVNNLDDQTTNLFFAKKNDAEQWKLNEKANLWADNDLLNKLHSMGWENNIIENIGLGKSVYNGAVMLAIPFFVKGVLVAKKLYNICKYPYIPKSVYESEDAGYIFPFDLWNQNELTYILEGEKDTITAQSLGINAITFGSATTLPNKMMTEYLRDKEVVICYDNDDAGHQGMYKLYKKLKDVVKSIHYIDIGEVVKEEKEDFYDFIHKYDCDEFDFYALNMYPFQDDSSEDTITLKYALQNNVINQYVTTVATVSSEYSDTYSVPSSFKVKKVEETGARNEQLAYGEEREWVLTDNNIQQALSLIEVDAKNANVRTKLLGFLGVRKEEGGIECTYGKPLVIYKLAITDRIVEDTTLSVDLYSRKPMIVGNQYKVTYKLCAHPSKNQKIVAVASDVESVSSVPNYQVNQSLLSQFRHNGSIKERLDYLYQSAKHHIASHLNYDIWLMADMVFNSFLDINYGKTIRGALDVFILGDTQVGKSETTSKLTQLYGYGQFLSLKTSTTVGLIGGSTKVDGSWCNTIGAIPKNNRKLVVLEEFSGADPSFIKTMTDIRSSNELRIARASGELKVPCKLRMITISNPINDAQGNPRFLCSFPNGVKPLMELITSAEDVSRYDGFLLVPKVEKRYNPFENELNGSPIPREAYVEKANWVTSRQPDNIIYDQGVEAYIWDKAEELNGVFECNFPLFGVTSSLKLARFCVAMASLLMNVDESFDNVIVTKEIVDYVCEFLRHIYTEPWFRLDKYKQEYDSYNIVTAEDIEELQKLYPANAVTIDFLSSTSKTSRNNLRTISGLDGDRFNPIFSKLVMKKFVRIEMDYVYPTEKFRKAYRELNKDFVLEGTSHLVDSIKGDKK